MADSDKEKERLSWQALKLQIQWDALKRDIKKTDVTAKKEETENDISTPPVKPTIPSNSNVKKNNLTNILVYGVMIAVTLFSAIFFTIKLSNVTPSAVSTRASVPMPTQQPPPPPPEPSDEESSSESSNESISRPIPMPTEGEEEQNIRIVKHIVEEYHKTHTYSKPDWFVCFDMAIDVWNMVKTKGINAKLLVGDVEKDVTNIREANHVWVMAETSPNKWIALETTGGFLVCSNQKICPVDNPRYYHGWGFDNPRELKEAHAKIQNPCRPGYILGYDSQCHLSCGGIICSEDAICVQGRCARCSLGYYLGEDLRCYRRY